MFAWLFSVRVTGHAVLRIAGNFFMMVIDLSFAMASPTGPMISE